jgi:hypothetical protein
MKKVLFIFVGVLLCSLALAQTVQPLYIRFDGKAINEDQLKHENGYWNHENTSLDEDIYTFWGINCDGVALTTATINKRNYIEINQSQLASYNVKTDVQVRAMIASMSYKDGVKYFMNLEQEKKLYVVEILPNNKARIYQVRNITSR